VALAYEHAGAFAEAVVETIREPLVVLDADLKVVQANEAFYRTFDVRPRETEGRLIFELGNRQWDFPALRELLEQIIPENMQIDGFVVEHDFPRIGSRKMILNARQTVRDHEHTGYILLAFDDRTEGDSRLADDENGA
jgi:PAS domain-containing protein